jgi:hypothetical protein
MAPYLSDEEQQMRAAIIAVIILVLQAATPANADLLHCHHLLQRLRGGNRLESRLQGLRCPRGQRGRPVAQRELEDAARCDPQYGQPEPRPAARRAHVPTEAMDRLSRHKLRLRGRTRLRRHGDRRQLFGMPLFAQLRTHQRFRPHPGAGDRGVAPSLHRLGSCPGGLSGLEGRLKP